MANMGVPELLILVAVAVLVIAVFAGIVMTVRIAGRGKSAPVVTPRGPMTPSQLDGHLRDLVARDMKIHAIKLLREQTGMRLLDAKNAIEGLALGHPIRHPALTPPPAAAPQVDLATRVRHLKESGNIEQAVFLVRGETGMDHDEATLFVNSL